MDRLLILPPLLFLALSVPIIYTEIRYRRIPDVVSFSLALVLIAVYAILLPERLIPGLLGGLMGFGTMWLLGRTMAIGGGDIKYSLALGILTGWKWVFPGIGIASLLGLLVFGGLYAAKKIPKDYPIPFGPFLLLGGILAYILDVHPALHLIP